MKNAVIRYDHGTDKENGKWKMEKKRKGIVSA